MSVFSPDARLGNPASALQGLLSGDSFHFCPSALCVSRVQGTSRVNSDWAHDRFGVMDLTERAAAAVLGRHGRRSLRDRR